MLFFSFLLAVLLMFIFTWAALNKPRQYAGTPNERLHFTWHAVQLTMVALFLLSGRLTTGESFNDALKLFADPLLFWSIIVSGIIYIILFRLWPKFIPKVPEWFTTHKSE
jgi:hypothetical protein